MEVCRRLACTFITIHNIETMNSNPLSACFCTSGVDACREFYQRHFAAEVIFDCGWYVNLRFGKDGPTLQFMQPRQGMAAFCGKGVVLNWSVDDVDAEHERLIRSGLDVIMPLEDHPWGDRGFSVADPVGNTLYIYSDREPSEEFRQYYKNCEAGPPDYA